MSGLVAAAGDAWGLRGKFELFGAAHLGVFVVVAVVLLFMSRVARDPRRALLSWRLDVALAMVLLWSYPAKLLTRYYGDMVMVVPYLPMHFCDWAAVAAFFALVFRSDRMAELTYFWGMAGTLQGLVTPALSVGFPHPAWFAFFQLHGGVVLVGLYLVIGHGWRPRKGAVLRVFVAACSATRGVRLTSSAGGPQEEVQARVVLVAAGLVDLISVENNYGFLRSKPGSGSMMDALGPWPIYILSMQAVALLFFTLFDMPFWRGRKRRAAG